MAYETFERRSVRIEQPALAVAANGRIALNAAATRLLEKSGIKAVKILWDKATCGIALLAAHKDDRDSYSLAFSTGYHSATLSAKAFVRHIGWSSKSRQTVFAKWNEQKKMLEAQLPPRFVGTCGKKNTTLKEDTGL
jgi:hypothetical protein